MRSRRTGTGERDQRGAATAAATGLVGVLLAVAAAASLGAAVLVDHRRAESAADLAALAGAAAVAGGDACAAAAGVAEANGTKLVSCEVRGRDVLVRVELRRDYGAGLVAGHAAQARAGPGGAS